MSRFCYLTAATYGNPAAIVARLKGYARRLHDFKYGAAGDDAVDASQIKDRVLLVAFEDGAATRAQVQAIEQAVKEIRKLYPKVKFKDEWIP